MLRQHGIRNVGEVEYAFLERTGQLSVFRYKEGSEKEMEPTFPDHLAKGGMMEG